MNAFSGCTFFHPGPFRFDVCRTCGADRATHRLRLEKAAEEQQGCLEQLILATPSGEGRNKLTEANIHLLAAITAFKEIP